MDRYYREQLANIESLADVLVEYGLTENQVRHIMADWQHKIALDGYEARPELAKDIASHAHFLKRLTDRKQRRCRSIRDDYDLRG